MRITKPIKITLYIEPPNPGFPKQCVHIMGRRERTHHTEPRHHLAAIIVPLADLEAHPDPAALLAEKTVKAMAMLIRDAIGDTDGDSTEAVRAADSQGRS